MGVAGSHELSERAVNRLYMLTSCRQVPTVMLNLATSVLRYIVARPAYGKGNSAFERLRALLRRVRQDWG